jgi:putative transposase
MTNHVHLLCTPSTSTATSQMMQSLGRMYVMYFNKIYHRTGTLWEGRYKSCLVQEETYLMELYRYIELNPVRAGMVKDPSDYSWSSYQINALGKKSGLLSPHELYLALGNDDKTRQASYRELFEYHVKGKLLDDIRKATNKGLALGNDAFIADVESLTGKQLKEGKRGRKPGWRKVE